MKNITPAFHLFPFVKISAGLDFQTLVEHRFRPPIAFRTIDHLRNWMAEHDLRETSIRYKKRREIEAELCFVVEGKVTTPLGALHYSQVWGSCKFWKLPRSMRALCRNEVRERSRFNGARCGPRCILKTFEATLARRMDQYSLCGKRHQ